MSTIIESLERRQLRDVPAFKAGDTVRVHFKVIEGNRQRVQVFEGICIKRQGSGVRETFTVRKSSFGVGVERTFPLHSPSIGKLEVVSRGHVRRAKLYYLRERRGKKARIRERRLGDEELAAIAAAEAERAAAGAAPAGDEAGEAVETVETDEAVESPETSDAEALEAEAPDADTSDAAEAPAAETPADEAPAADAGAETESSEAEIQG